MKKSEYFIMFSVSNTAQHTDKKLIVDKAADADSDLPTGILPEDGKHILGEEDSQRIAASLLSALGYSDGTYGFCIPGKS